MDDASVWEIDRLAAAEILTVLQSAKKADWPDLIAQVFAKARLNNYEWAAQRVRETVIDILEAEAVEEFQRKEAMWTDGFRHAEECLFAHNPSELLRVYPGSSKSTGQVLRSMVRSARQRPAFSF